ncbi:type IV secretion system protein (plasmid) [Ampullimonas aquatilis]|uniref:type IV secretion system protein n=1 Tax=Ampullimonas aquatilis TaxID=1341549 RepID=UPI003C74A5D1
MGIATVAETSIDTMLNLFVTTKSTALCTLLQPVALVGITIYLIVMGYATMRGDTNDPLHSFIWKTVKICMILAVALVPGQYQSYIVNGITGIQEGLLTAMGSATTIGGQLDNLFDTFSGIASLLFKQAITTTIPDLTLICFALVVVVSEIFIVTVSLGMYLLAKVSLVIIFAVGPAFILCAMFPATQRFTESWLGQALNFAVLTALLGTIIALEVGFLQDYMTKGKAQLVLDLPNIKAGYSPLDAVNEIIIISITLGVVLLNIDKIASALTGGASLQGLGREVASSLMRGFGAKSSPPKAGGGEIKSVTPSISSSPNSVPSYQSQTLNNIKRSA